MSWFKKVVRGAENLFRGQVGKGPIGAGKGATDFPTTDSPPQPQLGGDASTNAGDAVVNFQTKGVPGLQGPKPNGYQK